MDVKINDSTIFRSQLTNVWIKTSTITGSWISERPKHTCTFYHCIIVGGVAFKGCEITTCQYGPAWIAVKLNEHCTLENPFPWHSQKVNHLVNILLNKILSLAISYQSVNETPIKKDNGFPPIYDTRSPKMMIRDGSDRWVNSCTTKSIVHYKSFFSVFSFTLFRLRIFQIYIDFENDSKHVFHFAAWSSGKRWVNKPLSLSQLIITIHLTFSYLEWLHQQP